MGRRTFAGTHQHSHQQTGSDARSPGSFSRRSSTSPTTRRSLYLTAEGLSSRALGVHQSSSCGSRRLEQLSTPATILSRQVEHVQARLKKDNSGYEEKDVAQKLGSVAEPHGTAQLHPPAAPSDVKSAVTTKFNNTKSFRLSSPPSMTGTDRAYTLVQRRMKKKAGGAPAAVRGESSLKNLAVRIPPGKVVTGSK